MVAVKGSCKQNTVGEESEMSGEMIQINKIIEISLLINPFCGEENFK